MAASEFFTRIAQATARQCGRPLTIGLAFSGVALWAATGPYFHYSDSWQMAISTFTSLVTFLMVFLIQNTQNRDTAAIQLKLAELIRVSDSARNKLLNIEDMPEVEINQIRDDLARVAELGGSGLGELQEAKESLEQAEEQIDRAQEKIEKKIDQKKDQTTERQEVRV